MKRQLLLTITTIIAWTVHAQSHFYTSEKLSSNQITQICQDQEGYIWIGTEYGLNKYDGYRFTNYLHESGNKNTINSNVISYLFEDADGTLWVGTQLGLNRYIPNENRFESVEMKGATSVPRINSIVQEDAHHLLVGTAGYGLFRLDTRDNSTKMLEGYAKADNHYFSYIYIDNKGYFWKSGHGNSIIRRSPKGRLEEFMSPYGMVTGFVGYQGGVLIVCNHGLLYYRDGKMMTDFIDPGELRGKDLLLRTAKCDKNGNLFIGTMGNGLWWVPRGESRMKRYDHQTASMDLNTATIWALFQDKQENLWVGCQNRGLLLIPQQQSPFRSWRFVDQHISTGGSLTSICAGDNGMTWCAVQNNGVFGFDAQGRIVAHPQSPEGTYLIYRDGLGQYWIGTNAGLYAYNPYTGQSQLKSSFKSGFVNTITDDGKGRLFFSVYSLGFFLLDTNTGEQRHFSMYDGDGPKGRLHNDWIKKLMMDSRGKLWICTSSGINCYDPMEDSFRSNGWEVLLDYNSVESVCETSNHQLLFGTNTGLYIYDEKEKQTKPFTAEKCMSDKVVVGIVEDFLGDLWISTTMGLWQYKTADRQFVGYLYGNGLASREYVGGVNMRTVDGRIWFGFSDGITSFRPEALKRVHSDIGQVHLTGIYVGGVARPSSKHIELDFIDNTFSLEFSSLNFANAENVIYEYRLNGTHDWGQTDAGRNTVSFTHMQPGSYILEVRAYDNGIYTDVEVYHIIVHAPWYRSSWAYLIYILGVIGLLGALVWNYLRRRRQELDEEKMKFLINATHDIRSPLTLIMSPLHKLMKRDFDPDVKNDLKTIEHNAQRVQNLVTQILDIRKLDKQQMTLQCQETDMVQYVGNLLKSYEYTAKERDITFRYTPTLDKLNVWFDRKAIDKVIDNLLSNAFKYTFDRGEIEVRVSEEHGTTAVLQVIDNGMGIKGDPTRLFDRFYQGDSSRSMHIEGTGIGLNLCKMMVEMHHGTIEAAARIDDQGSVFTVRLPLGYEHLKKEEMLIVEETEKTTRQRAQTNYRVMIVDDDEEIGNYISQELGAYYHITPVTSGRDALRILLGVEAERQFDLVVSDVMMPEMDGFTLLRLIKTNMNINHIPVVMLTSKAAVANRLEGLEKGADAFLAKPFDMEELHMVINNLISKNLRLKGKYSGSQQQKDKVEEVQVKGNDEVLMERIMKVVNEHLDDSDFSVEMLSREVGVSRAQLHRKMKEMTGLSVSEFVRNIRLEQAARLLEEQKINVTQVAYTVGFSNLAHFSTVFRKQFGLSPTEYMEQKGPKNQG
ncbi:two-component regulator propeller domain-containing protein [Prevotella sp. P6B1]|uniref:two-component regulator propeller domain-containing protein n=1 Tax=Prevotella sp. P6B1 TaxID=1410613 RepID=UPI00051AB69E|nr:two-component regulator propeller domain-containing protein [Prevotella sp. P6B1]